MTWFKVDDGFADHPKVDALLSGKCPTEALALWTLAGAWCSKHLTDGAVPAGRVTRFGIRNAKAAAEELVRVGLWTRTDDGYAFHQWTQHQPTKEKVLAERDRKARNKRDSRANQQAGDESVTSNGVTAEVTAPVTGDRVVRHHVPSRPVPSSSLRSDDHGGAKGLSLVRDPDEPTPEERIAELAKRYPAPLLASVHEACRLSRTTGRMAPSVWLATLERLALIDAGHVVASMQAFLAGDHGPKGERYLVGIARNETKRGTAKPSAWRPPVAPEAYAASASTEADDAAALAALTDEDRAWLARKGVAHG